MKLGLLLSGYMESRRLTLRDFAKELGCDHTTLHRIIRDEPCRMDTLAKVITWMITPQTRHK